MTPTEGGKVTQFEPGVLQAVGRGMARALRSAADWFGPGEPLTPSAPPEVAGRQFDYPAQFNIQTRPRVYEATQFQDLRYLADGCELIRLVIETRKDQLAKLRWKIVPKDPEQEPDDTCKELEEAFAAPDNRHDWAAWYRMLLEDLFVIDAPAIYVRRNKGGMIWGFEVLDGATIAPLLDASGRMPLEGSAYMQTLKGLPAVQYTADEIVYHPRNPRPHKVYGYSPVEQIQWIANTAIRREVHRLRHYTDGSMPDYLMKVPESWTPEQISAYQKAWDARLSGNLSRRRGTTFVPGGMDPIDTKERVLSDQFDDWLARVVCFAFSISPQAFVKEMNRATAQTQKESSLQEGLMPLQLWTESLMNDLLRRLGRSEYKFSFEQDEATDPLVQAQIQKLYLDAGVLKKNEVRVDLGLDPIEGLDDPAPIPPAFGAAPAVGGTPGAAPVPPKGGQPQAEVPGGGEQPGKGEETPPEEGESEKLGKAKPKPRLRSINRDRPAMQAAMTAIRGGLAQRLGEFGRKVSRRLPRMLDKVEKKRQPDQVLAQILTAKDWEALSNWMAKQLAEVYQDGFDTAAAQVGVSVSLPNEAAILWAREHAGAEITRIAQATQEMIASSVALAEAEGWSNDELAEELAAGYGFSPERAETIARTETAFADIQGNVALYRDSGEVEGLTWITADEDPCPDCEDRDGQPIDIEDAVAHPPLHPNCRCDVLPVLSGREKDTESEKYAASELAQMIPELAQMKSDVQELVQKANRAELEQMKIDVQGLVQKANNYELAKMLSDVQELVQKAIKPRRWLVLRDPDGRVIGAEIEES